MFKKVLVSIYVTIVALSCVVGCAYDENRPQTRYHENVEGVEQFILSELGDYLMFEEPNHRSFELSLNDDKNENLIEWHIVFLRQYINYNDKDISRYAGEVMAEFLSLYNEYISDHPDNYLCDYYVLITFHIPAADKNDFPSVISCGHMTNYDNFGGDMINHNHNLLIGLSLEDEYWPYFYDQTRIEVAYMINNSFDKIIEVADNVPQIKKIIVADQTIADEATRLRPDVVFETQWNE